MGFRIASEHPDWIDGLIVQNANSYFEGLSPGALMRTQARGRPPLTSEQTAEVDKIVSRDFAMFLYKTGTRDPGNLNPDSWNLDAWTLANPTVAASRPLSTSTITPTSISTRAGRSICTSTSRRFLSSGVKKQIFLQPGAEIFKRDVPKTELHFFDTGHFALEEDAPGIADAIKRFY